MSTSIVACGDAAPVLEVAEGVLDAVPLPIERLVVRDRDLPASGGWDAGLDAALQEAGAKAVAVIAAVAKQFTRQWQDREKCGAALVVAGLASSQQQADQSTFLIAYSMEFRVQPAAGASDAAWSIPFFAKLAPSGAP